MQIETELMNKIVRQFAFASALLLMTGAVSLSGINTAHAQGSEIQISNVSHTTLPNGKVELSFTPLVAASFVITYDDRTLNRVVDLAEVNRPVIITINTVFGFNDDIVISIDTNEVARESVQVPPAAPTLVAGEITDTSIVLSWDESRSATQYTIYENNVFVTTVTTTTFTHTGLTPETAYTYTIESRYSTKTSVLSGALTVSTIAEPVTPTVTALSFNYNDNGSTEVTFTPSAAGSYTISYIIASGESPVTSVPVTVTASQANNPVTATLQTLPGYVGTVAILFDSTESARDTIAVPPAAPTLVAVTVTITTVDLSWEASRSATRYQIYVDGTPLSIVSGTVYFHAGLTSGTEYTYTVEASYGGVRSTRSAALTVTTLVAPTVAANRLADNSIELSWEGVITKGNFALYTVLLVEGGTTNQLTFTISPYTVAPDDRVFSRIYNADRIGVGGLDEDGSSTINAIFTSIPDLTPGIPTLSRGEVTATTVELSWTATLGAANYELFRDANSVGTTASLTFTDTGLTPETRYFYTIRSIDDSSLSSDLSARLRATTIAEAVTPVTPPVSSLSFTYRDNGNTVVLFIPSEAGRYTISYTIATGETAVPSASINIAADHVDGATTVTLLTGSGYAGTVAVSFGDIEYASGTIAVPPTPPTLNAVDTTATSVEFSWTAQRGAVSYELFRNDISIADSITALTFTDTRLTPGTTYTYTITSTDGTSTSAPSAPLTVTTTISIANLDGDESSVSLNDAKFLYYAHALGPALNDSNQATVLGPLTSTGNNALGSLLTAAKALSADLNGDGATNAEDVAVLYYSFALEVSLGNGTDTKPGIKEIKKTILGPLTGTDDDMATIDAMLQRVYEVREP